MNRSLLIDGTKVLASQLIVLHHLAIYAPMSTLMREAWPQAIDLIAEHGRLAVQPFLVLGGWLAATSISRQSTTPWLGVVIRRYLRLAPPLAVALLLVMAATAAFQNVLHRPDWLSPLPDAKTWVAHLLLLQDVLGIPSLSAGAWYVAIDLQCFALLGALAVWQRRAGRTASAAPGPALLALATTASAVLFNRDPALDTWAVYFLCAYGLGVLAAWGVHDRSARRWFVLTVAVVLVDLAIDTRTRPALALGTALTLWAVTGHTPSPANLVADVTANAILSAPSWPTARGLVSSLGNVAYGVFVVHFAVIIAVSGLWQLGGWASLESAVGFSALVWVGSLALGTLIHTHVERAPIQRPSPTMH